MLPQRISRYQRLQLPDHLAVPAEVQVGLDARLQGLQPQIRQPRHLSHGQELRRHIGQRLAPATAPAPRPAAPTRAPSALPSPPPRARLAARSNRATSSSPAAT